MKLNRIEKALMNNPIRAAFQRRYEASILERLGGRLDGARVVEIGCGRGVGTEIILKRFGAREVHAYDLDPDMVARAQLRLANYAPARVRLRVGDAACIAEPDGAFGAVFDFGVLHHVPQWRSAAREVRRLLEPGGRFFFEEVTRQALERWPYRTFLDHPTEDRFSAEDLLAELDGNDIHVGGRCVERFFGDFVIGVGVAG